MTVNDVESGIYRILISCYSWVVFCILRTKLFPWNSDVHERFWSAMIDCNWKFVNIWNIITVNISRDLIVNIWNITVNICDLIALLISVVDWVVSQILFSVILFTDWPLACWYAISSEPFTILYQRSTVFKGKRKSINSHPLLYLLMCLACGIGPRPGRLSFFSAITLLVGSYDL